MPVPVNMTSLAQSVAGLSAAERRAVKPANRKETDKAGAKRGDDEVIIGVDAVDNAEAARTWLGSTLSGGVLALSAWSVGVRGRPRELGVQCAGVSL